ncbi:TPA: PssE/Cps14G family polysaccharide biosynthesis glycosyltransferase [Streptococcus pneumoniae]
MIFITVGTQKHPFNRLLKKIDQLIELEVIKGEVFAQIGASDYKPKYFSYNSFLSSIDMNEKMREASMVITHGGTASIVKALKLRKKIIAVPRLEQFGEHVDNHQLQIITVLGEEGYILPCFDIEQLGTVYQKAQTFTTKPYISNSYALLEDIRQYIDSL